MIGDDERQNLIFYRLNQENECIELAQFLIENKMSGFHPVQL